MNKLLLAALVAVLLVVVAWHAHEADTARRLDAIEAYCAAVSPGMCRYLRAWADESGSDTWLCGPTSYALAGELNARFFGGELPIVATPTGGDCIVIKLALAQVPLGGGEYFTGDHGWIEIHWRGLVIFVDPTFTYWDRMDRILFSWFDENNDGARRMARFKSILRLCEPDAAHVRLLADPAKYLAGTSEMRRLLDSGSAPGDWLAWAERLQRDGVWSPAD
jgi:hypothetical protein